MGWRGTGYLTIILILTYAGISFASLPPPPVVQDTAVQQYFQNIYTEHNKITVLTSSPNGVRNGASGQIVLVNSGGTFTFWVNQGGTVWVSV